jgi:hypothetical protein
MNDKTDMVQIQRDELRMALGELYDRLRHGVLNGMFPEKCHRRPNDIPDAKCRNGKTRREVMWYMGTCCFGCNQTTPCHLSLEEYDVFNAMNMAKEVLKKQPAEMPNVRPEDFPSYDPNVEYRASPRWIARQFYRFAGGYWMFANHSDKEQEKKWDRAYNDLLCISLGTENGRLLRKVVEAGPKIVSDQEYAKKWAEENPWLDGLVEKAREALSKQIKGENDIETLVFRALAIRFDYEFGRDYPGGDIDVYDGVFCEIFDACLIVAGLYPYERPEIYDFEDKREYWNALIAFNHEHKKKLYSFMSETDGLETKEMPK